MRKSCAIILLFSFSQCYAMERRKKKNYALKKVVSENFADFADGTEQVVSSYKVLKNIMIENDLIQPKGNKKTRTGGKQPTNGENSGDSTSLSLGEILGRYKIAPNLLVTMLQKATHVDVDMKSESKKLFRQMQIDDPEGYIKMSHAACRNLQKRIAKGQGLEEYKAYKVYNQNEDEVSFKQLAMKKSIE